LQVGVPVEHANVFHLQKGAVPIVADAVDGTTSLCFSVAVSSRRAGQRVQIDIDTRHGRLDDVDVFRGERQRGDKALPAFDL